MNSFGVNLFVGVCCEKAPRSTGAVDGRCPPTLGQRLQAGEVISKLEPVSLWTFFSSLNGTSFDGPFIVKVSVNACCWSWWTSTINRTSRPWRFFAAHSNKEIDTERIHDTWRWCKNVSHAIEITISEEEEERIAESFKTKASKST
jgi:hypothetical protein